MNIRLLLSTSYLAFFSLVFATFLLNLCSVESKCIPGVFEKYPGGCPDIPSLSLPPTPLPLSRFLSLPLFFSISFSLYLSLLSIYLSLSLSLSFFLPFSLFFPFLYAYLKLYFFRHFPSFCLSLYLLAFFHFSFSFLPFFFVFN